MIKIPDSKDFNIKSVNIMGDDCILITPQQMGVDWTEENKWFRSSIWRTSDLHPVSLGWRKFTNLGEQVNFEPFDKSNFNAIRKLDGSCLIVSCYKGEVFARTRGTIDASTLQNGNEIETLKQKYPNVFDTRLFESMGEDVSFLYEWTTPTNQIVLQETLEPSLWLTGIVKHKDYSYFTQVYLDDMAIKLGVLRPEKYDFTFSNLLEFIQNETSIEGVVCYFNDDQILKKIKTPRYCELHSLFTGNCSESKIVDNFFEFNCPEYDEFVKILSKIDYEWCNRILPTIDVVYQRYTAVQSRISNIQLFIADLITKDLTRKEQAAIINTNFKDHEVGVAFTLLSNKKLKMDKLYWQL